MFCLPTQGMFIAPAGLFENRSINSLQESLPAPVSVNCVPSREVRPIAEIHDGMVKHDLYFSEYPKDRRSSMIQWEEFLLVGNDEVRQRLDKNKSVRSSVLE